MSANYTCNQFDNAYKPTRLGNWEVPKWHLNRPKGRSTVTKVIANDRGHLLPGVQKTDQKHWAGLYLGTYQLPKRISKDAAIELTSPKCQSWMKRSYHHPFIDRGQRRKNENNDKLENINACKERTDEMNRDADRGSIISVKSAISNVPANVSSFDTARNCTSADGALNSTAANNDDGGRGSAGGGGHTVFSGGCGDTASTKTPSSPDLSRISVSGCDEGVRRHHHHHRHRHHQRHQPKNVPVEPEQDPVAAETEEPGRRYEDAHKHHGLPDAIEDAVYRSLQTKRHKHPGLGLEGCWPKCSAVAYKSFNDPGPTQCSKLRVYRPKTSSPGPGLNKKGELARRGCKNGSSPRPNTCVPVVTAQQLSDIKLALCWDLDAPFDRNRPTRPHDEPAVFHKVRQPPQQQHGPQSPECPGGSAIGNGASAAQRKPPPQNSSAVMGFVRAPPAENGNGGGDIGKFVPESKRMQTRECLLKNRNLSAVMELIPTKDPPCGNGNDNGGGDGDNCGRTQSEAADCNNRSASSSRNAGKNGSNADRADDGKSNGDVQIDHGCSDKPVGEVVADDGLYDNTRRPSPTADCPSERRRLHRRHHRRMHRNDASEKEQQQQQQQQRHSCRPCVACDNPDVVTCDNGRKDDECGHHYKMAFKAGVPISTPVKHRAAAAGQPAKHLKVPKPRTTNSDKKKYVIGTLLPPFSMWPGTTARDYPEHWRLTSVYRQAFKPLELRKQPLLQTIYL